MSSLCVLLLLSIILAVNSAHGNNHPIPAISQKERHLGTSTLEYGTCFRVKEDSGNDDDGNAYFYNGAYRAAYTRYASFFLCTSYDESSNDKECNGPYVTDLDTYLQTTTNFASSYCQQCWNTCGRRRLLETRQLEDAEQNNQGDAGGYYGNVDCGSCSNECHPLKNNNNPDEMNHLYCQASNDNGGDMAYYSAPQCNDGQVVIGDFYDDECIFKTNRIMDYQYSMFETIETMSMDCSSGSCDALTQDAINCYDGADGDDYRVCKAAQNAGRTRTFYRKPWYAKLPVGIIFVALLLMGVGGFLAYTYYIRHTQRPKIPMSVLDGEVSPHSQVDSPGKKNLPPIA